jgi:hypothetical protein
MCYKIKIHKLFDNKLLCQDEVNLVSCDHKFCTTLEGYSSINQVLDLFPKDH